MDDNNGVWGVFSRRHPKTHGELFPHFTAEEFRCSDGTFPHERDAENIIPLLYFLEGLRASLNGIVGTELAHGMVWDEGIKVTSGYRTPEHNKAIGGAPDSAHPEFKAADIIPSSGFRCLTWNEWAWLCEHERDGWRVNGKEYRLGFYPRSHFIHVDCAFGKGSTEWWEAGSEQQRRDYEAHRKRQEAPREHDSDGQAANGADR